MAAETTVSSADITTFLNALDEELSNLAAKPPAIELDRLSAIGDALFATYQLIRDRRQLARLRHEDVELRRNLKSAERSVLRAQWRIRQIVNAAVPAELGPAVERFAVASRRVERSLEELADDVESWNRWARAINLTAQIASAIAVVVAAI